MGQRGLQVHQNPCNRGFLWSSQRDWAVAIFAPLRLVTIKSLRGTLLDSKTSQLECTICSLKPNEPFENTRIMVFHFD